MVNFVWQKVGRTPEYASMSEATDSHSKPIPRQGDSDTQTLDHVEKWMAVIREINTERRPQAKLPD